MTSTAPKWIPLALAVSLCAPVAWAQTPQTEVTPGEVIGVEVIRLEGDGGVAAGATMGGMIGVMYGRSAGHSRAVTRRRTALGAAAKRALLAAETDDAIDRAVIRISILCDD